MNDPPAIIFRLDRTKDDPALRPGARGARKAVVRELRPDSEFPLTQHEWAAPADPAGKCPVVVMPTCEMSVFNETATQDRHLHREATEIYLVLEGRMLIEVENVEHTLWGGDVIFVRPGATHHVKPSGHRFLCRVITVDYPSPRDKVVVPD